ncbi:ribulose-phosphate 3-epimerase [bacterium]|nr:ribulose-phosphate 3-epimerase [bacterium]
MTTNISTENSTDRKIKILPSLLAADFLKLGEQAKEAMDSGADGLHADIMDGHFVPPITYGAEITKTVIEHTRARVDAHLMVDNPQKLFNDFKEAGVCGITIHAEAVNHLHRYLGMIRELGLEAGIALNPATAITETLRYTIPLVDRVLIMTVNPGWGGQPLILEAMEKIHIVNRIMHAKKAHFEIQVDGGVNAHIAGELVRLGATELVAGTAVFKGDIRENISKLRRAVEKGLRNIDEKN